MSNDHYVAKTYLKHFAGPSGILRAYRKSDGRSFPCWPADICHEPNGDIIPDFLSDPAYLGEFRSAFEPGWNDAIEALKAHAVDMRNKLQIAGYWANLMVCTPTWRRVEIKISNERMRHLLAVQKIVSVRTGNHDALLVEAIDCVERGEISVETESDWVRARTASSILSYAWALYNSEWDVLENDTAREYVTSDNPSSFEDRGDNWEAPGTLPFVRFLPVTPRLCIVCDLTRLHPAIRNAKPNFEQRPTGTVRGGFVPLETVERINAAIAKCAEDLVLCGAESDYVRDLTAKYSDFHVENESARFEQNKGFLVATRTRVIERKNAKG